MYIKQVNNISDIIKELYATDQNFIDKYHIYAGQGYELCCERTMKDLVNHNIPIQGIYDNNDLVGYFGKENPEVLTGLFIKPKYRKDKDKIWQMIKDNFENNFYTYVYMKNLPAYYFYKKRGKEIERFELDCEQIALIYFVGE